MSILAADVGGTRIKLGVVVAGRVAARTVIASRAGAGLAAALPRIAAAWQGLLAGLPPPRATAWGLPFLVDAGQACGVGPASTTMRAASCAAAAMPPASSSAPASVRPLPPMAESWSAVMAGPASSSVNVLARQT